MRSSLLKRITALALAAVLALSLIGCGAKNDPAPEKDAAPSAGDPAADDKKTDAPEEQGGSEKVKALAGAYAVDITDLGMPLSFYLVISEDGTFQLTNQVTDGEVSGAVKGSGKVGESDGVYMLVYDDSTAEASKTATFQVENGNLVFTQNLPYGSSNISANLEGPEPIYPTAKSMAYSEYLGVYAGSFAKNVEAMGASIDYDYSLELTYGAEYTFTSSFTVMGEAQIYAQSGVFAVDNGKLTLTAADGAAYEGAISADGEIAITLPLSAMSKEGDAITMQPATTADYAGSYYGIKAMAMGPMTMNINASLKLDMLGGYSYTAGMEGEEPYAETGTYAPNADGTLTFTADADGAEPQTGTLSSSDCLTASFRINAAVPNATEIVFYSGRVQGTFSAEEAEGQGAVGTLTLNPDGTYHFTLDQGGTVTEEDGTFTVGAGMAGAAVELTSASGSLSSGSVSDDGINLNYTTAAGEVKSFQMVPAPAESEGMGGMPSGAPAGMG